MAIFVNFYGIYCHNVEHIMHAIYARSKRLFSLVEIWRA